MRASERRRLRPTGSQPDGSSRALPRPLRPGEMRVAVRWTTCTGAGRPPRASAARPAARASRFAQTAREGDAMRRLPHAAHPGGRSWHMLGSGTVTCTRARHHDLAAGEPGRRPDGSKGRSTTSTGLSGRFEGTIASRPASRSSAAAATPLSPGARPETSRPAFRCAPRRRPPRRAHPARVAAVRRRRWAGDAEQDGRPVAARAGAAGRRGAAQARGPRTRDHGVRGEGGLA